MIERVQNWPMKLNQIVEGFRTTPFIWGIHDCGTFACACYEAVTGKKINDTVVPRNTLTQYLRLVAGSPNGVVGLAESVFGPGLDDWAVARRGDLVLLESPRVELVGIKQAMGVCLGSSCACVGLTGLEFVSVTCAVKVFRIGP